jgi:aspartate racemase
MRTLGLIGGMAWPSTLDAYRQLNEQVAERLGGHHSAELLLWSVDFARVEVLQTTGRWDEAGALLADGATRLERAGAEGLLLCTNTMHRVADAIESAVAIPLLHIADATASRIQAAGQTRVGLLGTRFTMEEPFYRDRLQERGIEVLIPGAEDRTVAHQVIYDELVHGTIEPASRTAYVAIAERLVAAGAQAVIAGCTEIELLVHDEDLTVPLYPTTAIHVAAAVDWMLGASDAITPTVTGHGR